MSGGGRTAYQQARRRRTRDTILAAAETVFRATPFIFASIDDIIRAAGVSRATFYMHFETKLALALAIYDGIAPDWWALFQELASLDHVDIDALSAWVRRMAELYVSHGYVSSLVLQLNVFEPDFHARLLADREAVIDRLGDDIPAFRAARGQDETSARARVAARLLLDRLDQICTEITGRPVPPESEVYIRLIAEELSRFLSATSPG